jgi:hypothetical protein
MRNTILGGIGILWGAGMLFTWLTSPPAGSAAYQGGAAGAGIFGGLMLIAGLVYFFKKPA